MPVPGTITPDLKAYYEGTIIPINEKAVAAQAKEQTAIQKAWIAYDKEKSSFWTTFSTGVLTLLGAYKQYEMYKQMGDMYEAQKEYLDETREIMKDNYNSLFKPQYQASTGHLWGYVNNWGKGVIETAAACGTRICEYVRDPEVFNRAMAQVPSFVNKAKRIGMRSLKRGQVGACCDNEFRFGALQAGLMTKALNLAERYEDDKALRWNQFYWGRMSSAAAMADSQYKNAISLVTGASTGLTNIVSNMGQSVTQGSQVSELGMNALGNKANFWGGLSGTAGMFMGNQAGSQSMSPLSGIFGGGSPTTSSGSNQWLPSQIDMSQGMGPPQDSSSIINGF
jgi:hypothetical protein